MKILSYFNRLLILAAATMVVACQQAPEETPGLEQAQKPIRISAKYNDYTRVSGVQFEKGDMLSISAFCEDGVPYIDNAAFTCDNSGEFHGDQTYYWPTDDSSIYFLATHPYQPLISELNADYAYPFSVELDQRTHAAFSASDLMVATAAGNQTQESVMLSFIRTNSKILFYFDNRLGEQITSVRLAGVDATFVLHYNFGVNADPEAPYGQIQLLSMRDFDPNYPYAEILAGYNVAGDGEGAWSLIIPTQSVTNPQLIVTTESGAEYSYHLSGTQKFEYGHKYQANVVLDRPEVSEPTKIEIVWSIAEWIEGGEIEFLQPGDIPDRVVTVTHSLSQFTLPYVNPWENNFLVSWGDGVEENLLATSSGDRFTHTYTDGEELHTVGITLKPTDYVILFEQITGVESIDFSQF